MNQKDFLFLYQQIQTLVAKGEEQEAKAFLIEHLNDFPPELREKIIFAFFYEALEEASEEEKSLEEFRTQTISVLNEIREAKKEAQQKLDQINLKERLTKGN